jgi:hypothetical protein
LDRYPLCIVQNDQIGIINVGYFLGYLFSILGEIIADIAVIEGLGK